MTNENEFRCAGADAIEELRGIFRFLDLTKQLGGSLAVFTTLRKCHRVSREVESMARRITEACALVVVLCSWAIPLLAHHSFGAEYDAYTRRVRRWLIPTTLRPPMVTSPGPSPAKQSTGDHSVRSIGPR